ncbi:PDZ domain-containing protein, partial [bacterium]
MKPILRGSALILSLAACFGFGYYYKDVSRGSAPGGRAINTLLGVQTTSPSLSAEAAFRENYARILNNFPRKLDAKTLKYSGMEGLVGALGDPHTNFFPPETAKMFREETEAKFFGVGASLQEDPLGVRIAKVFEDGPAFGAGVRAGDIVTAVDGVSLAGKASEFAVSKIKGAEGTP